MVPTVVDTLAAVAIRLTVSTTFEDEAARRSTVSVETLFTCAVVAAEETDSSSQGIGALASNQAIGALAPVA